MKVWTTLYPAPNTPSIHVFKTHPITTCASFAPPLCVHQGVHCCIITNIGLYILPSSFFFREYTATSQPGKRIKKFTIPASVYEGKVANSADMRIMVRNRLCMIVNRLYTASPTYLSPLPTPPFLSRLLTLLFPTLPFATRLRLCMITYISHNVFLITTMVYIGERCVGRCYPQVKLLGHLLPRRQR